MLVLRIVDLNMAMIAIFKWSINSGLPMGLRKARESLRSEATSATCQPPASHARVHDLSANAARDIRKLLTKKMLGVVVDLTRASWNQLRPWLGAIQALRLAT